MHPRPITLREARRFVAEHHRHNEPPRGWLFGVGLEHDGALVGVAIVGRPVGRGLQDGYTAEVLRVCVLDGQANACSLLYGRCARAAAALGYRRIVTYTLASEPGTSLRAAGWSRDAELPARERWDYTGQTRVQTDLFGHDRRPPDAKVRWSRTLGRAVLAE